MEKINIEDIIKATKGDVFLRGKKKIFDRVSIDTRKIKRGDLFIALKGKNFDGHEFIGEAIKKGAAGIIASKNMAEFFGQRKKNINLSVIQVRDTLFALQEIARFYRNMFNCTVVGITGSNGKTTTKEMIAAILKNVFPVLATEGNFNNHIGLPLTLLRLNDKHKVCVLEMGASGKGEIARLAALAKPKIGVITNVSNAHLESFGSIKNILSGKMELIDALPKNGIAVLNADNFLLNKIISKNEIKSKLISYGIKNKGTIYASHIKSLVNGLQFRLHIEDAVEEITLPVIGLFNVYNALAASAVSWSLNVELSVIKNALENFIPLKMHMEKISCKGIEIINDAYNANPVSMKNAIISFFEEKKLGKKILVLGDMLELGKSAVNEHRKIGKIAAKNCDILFTLGDLSSFIAEEAHKNGLNIKNIFVFKNKKDLISELKNIIKKNDSILFKASRSINLEKVVDALKNVDVKN